jgi:hypothetical protein
VTEKVRAALKTSGRLAGEEKEFQVFDSLSWTEAQKRDARQYRPGMAIRFHRGRTGFAKDETVRWSPSKMIRSKFNARMVLKTFSHWVQAAPALMWGRNGN